MDQTDDTGSSEHQAPAFELNPADWTTADEIRRRSFSTAEHGFDPDEVRDYLGKLADWFSDLNVQLSGLRKSQQAFGAPASAQAVAPPAVPGPGPGTPPEVGGLAARMADVLREAEEHASRVRADAELRAEQMLAQSREEADRVRSESGGAIARARVEAEERLRRANEAREALLAEIRTLREHLAELTGRLEEASVVSEDAAGPPEPASPRRPAQGRATGPAVVLPDAVDDATAETVVVDGMPVPGPRVPADPSQAGRPTDPVRADAPAGDDGASLGLETTPSTSNVRAFPGVEARAMRDPGGDNPSPA